MRLQELKVLRIQSREFRSEIQGAMSKTEGTDKKISFKERLWDFLGSRNLSVFIFVMALTYTLILIVFAFIVPTQWVNRIAALLPFKILYLVFFINLAICEIKWIPVLIRRCRKPKCPETVEELQRFRHRIEVRSQESGARRLEKYLRWRGYKVRESEVRSQKSEGDLPIHRFTDSPILYAYRGRFSPFGNLLFHIGFLFLLLGVWAGSFSSFDSTTMLMEGEDFVLPSTDRQPISFRVEKITPAFWKDVMLFTDLKADVRYPYLGEVRSGVARLAQPLNIGDVKIAISGVGYAPMYVLKDKNGENLDSGFVRLNIFPPGNEDHFQIPGYPHQIFVSFYPDHEMTDGKIKNRSMNQVNSAYYIKIFRNKVLSYAGVLKPGEEAYYEGLRLSFPEFKYWGMFRMVKNPGFVYIWIAFILFGTGLIWRLLFYKREIVVVKEGEALYLYGNSDYSPQLFENRLRVLAE